MNFQNWITLQESSLQNLYTSTVKAFPKTTRRQYAIDPINIAEVKWTPFLGVHTVHNKNNEVFLGPTSTPVFGRESYKFLENFKLTEIKELLPSFLIKILTSLSVPSNSTIKIASTSLGYPAFA